MLYKLLSLAVLLTSQAAASGLGQTATATKPPSPLRMGWVKA